MVRGFRVVYVLVSKKEDCFYEMFLLSLYSLRLHEPLRQVTVVADSATYDFVRSKKDPLLENVESLRIDVPEMFDNLQKSRYLKIKLREIIEGDFLYIDTDTLVCEPLSGLDSFDADIAAVPDENGPVRVKNRFAAERCRKAGFGAMRGGPFFNGGVFYVRDTDLSRRFFDAWYRRWLESLRNGVSLDQPALCKANLDTGCPIRELPGEWNCQVCANVGPHFLSSAKIVHYYASYSSFSNTVLLPHVKEPGKIDDTASAIAKDPRGRGTELYQHSYKGRFKACYSNTLYKLIRHPAIFSSVRNLSSFLSRPISWVRSLKDLMESPSENASGLSSSSSRERLGRGLVVMMTSGGVFLSWRLSKDEDPVLGTALKPLSFSLFRDGGKIIELEGKTNYLDPEGTLESEYKVVSSKGDDSGTVRPFPSGENWFDIPLARPADSPFGPYTISDVSVGDLDGDGVYELVVKWDSAGRDNSVTGLTGSVLLDAYKLDGTRLWEKPIDLGPNIRAGAHYTQVLVYDFDRDGKSEIILKTAPGSKDAKGCFVNHSSGFFSIREVDNGIDFRDDKGMVLDGDEFLTVFRGGDGKALDTIYYPNQRVDSTIWGDDQGNRSERYTAAVAWLDGKKPYGVFMRGYYWGRKDPKMGRQCACAVSFDGRNLSCANSFDTFDVKKFNAKRDSVSFTRDGKYKGVEGYRRGNEKYIGNGNHNCAVADVDGDGREEVLTGALCYKLSGRNRLKVKWCTYLGHGDVLHLGAYGPKHKGYQFFTVHECGKTHPFKRSLVRRKPMELDYGFTVLDPKNGRSLFHVGSPGDMGRGMMADVGAGGYYQFWGVSEVKGSDERVLVGPFSRAEKGFEIIDIPGVSTNFRVFWDGTLRDNLLDGEPGGPLEVTAWNGERMERIFKTKGCVSINGTKANPCLQADILGDWREELVMAREDNEALRVFVSDIPTGYSMMTLMHDSVYRAGVAAEQTCYNQPPHAGVRLRDCFGNN